MAPGRAILASARLLHLTASILAPVSGGGGGGAAGAKSVSGVWCMGDFGQPCTEACVAEGGLRCAAEGDWTSREFVATAANAGHRCAISFVAEEKDFPRAPYWREGSMCWSLKRDVVPDCQGLPGKTGKRFCLCSNATSVSDPSAAASAPPVPLPGPLPSSSSFAVAETRSATPKTIAPVDSPATPVPRARSGADEAVKPQASASRAANATTWYLGPPGQHCTEVCSQHGTTCLSSSWPAARSGARAVNELAGEVGIVCIEVFVLAATEDEHAEYAPFTMGGMCWSATSVGGRNSESGPACGARPRGPLQRICQCATQSVDEDAAKLSSGQGLGVVSPSPAGTAVATVAVGSAVQLLGVSELGQKSGLRPAEVHKGSVPHALLLLLLTGSAALAATAGLWRGSDCGSYGSSGPQRSKDADDEELLPLGAE